MIPGTCPDCGASRPLPDYLADADARQALAAALALPSSLARGVVPYLALHAPQGRRVQMGKLTRLLRELTELVTAGTITRHGTERPCPMPVWIGALEQVLAARDAGTLSIPLDGHAYLTEIAWRQAAKPGGSAVRTRTTPNDEPQRDAHRRGETPMGHHASHRPAHLDLPQRTDRETGLRAMSDIATTLRGRNSEVGRIQDVSDTQLAPDASTQESTP